MKISQIVNTKENKTPSSDLDLLDEDWSLTLRDEGEHHATLLYAGDSWARAAQPSGPAYVYIRRRAVPLSGN